MKNYKLNRPSIFMLAIAIAFFQSCVSAPKKEKPPVAIEAPAPTAQPKAKEEIPQPVKPAVKAVPEVKKAKISHKVASGDTLGGIAIRYTGKVTNWKKIAEYNNIKNPTLIKIGHILYIPEDIFDRDRGPSKIPIGRKTKNAEKPAVQQTGSSEKTGAAQKKELQETELGELGEVGEMEFTEMGTEGELEGSGETKPLK